MGAAAAAAIVGATLVVQQGPGVQRGRPGEGRDYHAFWKLYGLALPDGVLKKLYYRNALALVPGLPKDGWPE
jgi:hypothetical protein